MLGLEAVDLQLDRDQAVQAAVEEQEVEREVAPAHLQRKLGADEAAGAAKFDEEGAQLLQQAAMQVSLGVAPRQRQELQGIGILERGRRRVAMRFSHHR